MSEPLRTGTTDRRGRTVTGEARVSFQSHLVPWYFRSPSVCLRTYPPPPRAHSGVEVRPLLDFRPPVHRSEWLPVLTLEHFGKDPTGTVGCLVNTREGWETPGTLGTRVGLDSSTTQLDGRLSSMRETIIVLNIPLVDVSPRCVRSRRTDDS